MTTTEQLAKVLTEKAELEKILAAEIELGQRRLSEIALLRHKIATLVGEASGVKVSPHYASQYIHGKPN